MAAGGISFTRLIDGIQNSFGSRLLKKKKNQENPIFQEEQKKVFQKPISKL